MELNGSTLYKYQNGFMTVEEVLDFEELLEANPEFVNNLTTKVNPVFKNVEHNNKLVRDLIPKLKPATIKVVIATISNQLKRTFKGIKTFGEFSFLPPFSRGSFGGALSFRRLALAVSILLIIGLGWWWQTTSKDNLIKDLATKSLDSAPLLQQSAGVPADNDTLCDCGINLREEFLRDNETKAKFLSFLGTANPNAQCKAFWQGWAKISDDKYAQSIPFFEEVLKNSSPSQLHQEAAHGLIIAYLFEKNKKKAIEICRELSNQTVFSKPAKDLASKVLKEFDEPVVGSTK